MGFSDSPAGKESAYNAGDPGLIPGSGRSAGEGMGYSLQDSWASFVAQLVKKVKVKSLGHVWLFVTPWTVAYQASPSMEFSRQEYWNGLPFPSPGDPPNPGIEPGSSALQADTLPSKPPRKPPAMWETWVWSLGWEDPLQKEKATHSSILGQRIPWTV